MIKKNTRRNIILILLFLLVFTGIDILLAALFVKNSDRRFRSRHYYYHHGLLPNQKALASWYNIPYSMFTNSLGFRDSEIRTVPLKSAKRRILFMGDSHTEGIGMKFSDTFTGQLSTYIDTSQIEILNAAAVSYSPRIYYLKTNYLIENTGISFDELFVFIDISDIQNEIVYERFQPEIPGRVRKFLFSFRNRVLNKSFTLHTLADLNQKRQTARFLEKADLFDSYRENGKNIDALDLYASFFSGFDDNTLLANPRFHGVSGWLNDENFKELANKGLELGEDNMQKLCELCRKNGIKMTISVHPWQEQIALMEPEDMYVKFWKDFAEKNGIGFINFYPVFINPPISAVMGTDFFIPGDNHWNKNGHWLVAKELNKYLN
jgi:hypothetical protein